jgi:PIN domain nuclease of toxin-antitoxin system
MRLLLDTQAFLWLATGDSQLSKKAKNVFLDEDNDCYFSLASIWEIAIKTSLGKLKLHQPLEKFILNQLQENSIEQLNIHFRHVTRTKSLPFHHRDPFDRLIIAQSQEEELSILSNDKIFDKYKVDRIW